MPVVGGGGIKTVRSGGSPLVHIQKRAHLFKEIGARALGKALQTSNDYNKKKKEIREDLVGRGHQGGARQRSMFNEIEKAIPERAFHRPYGGIRKVSAFQRGVLHFGELTRGGCFLFWEWPKAS